VPLVRIAYLIAVGSLLVSCHERKPAMPDSEFEKFRAAWPGMTKQCLDEIRYYGILAWRPDDPDCFEMMPAQQWSGLWETGWEWSNFCPSPATECDWMAKRGIWLTFAKDAYHGPERPDGVYQIHFIGRRTKAPAQFGHQGNYDHLIVVDRLISMSQVSGTEER
jgi:hypothetical protein